ncbi:MAG: glycerophosphoryl diester phosphodiesterase [Candidatus Magnetoglobus multicellularis str. Araruama]|uniref:Glycerophosphoryl diester phosphodiesterase n=1 Tax=Candidatus Magnetoglobus multicellularis str. Araruama TaxID=890399 RepID=A0A1V1PI35_9BACT|nr:MAG: glycerophosphoryl diester phosphodiesterase [Candidatus Magnetoglobus multicellularis str. Araruama]
MMITNIAHRGARLIAPENTLEAARMAYQFGSSMWELDVQYTADKQLIVIHDDTLERTSDIHLFSAYKHRHPWRVCDFTASEIQLLNSGYSFQNHAKDIPFKKYQAPLLDEAIHFSKDIGLGINIEIKDHKGLPGHDTIASQVYDTAKKHDYLPQILFSSFNINYLFQIRAIDADARIAVLMDTHDHNILDLLLKINAQAYHPYWELIDQETIDLLHQQGILVNVWTVNSRIDMIRLIKIGVDGIITDNPALLDSLGGELELGSDLDC